MMRCRPGTIPSFGVRRSGACGGPGALQQATQTVPFVFVLVADPVGAGFVAGLGRPGGNATGFPSLSRYHREMAAAVPTTNEAGLPEFQALPWFALFTPKGVPRLDTGQAYR